MIANRLRVHTLHQCQHGGGLTLVFWLLVLGSLTLLFNGFIDRRDNPNAGLATVEDGDGEVVLKSNPQGHYVAPGRINDEEAEFLLDTGATDVSVPEGLARRAGLEPGRQMMVGTANGVVAVHQTTIDAVHLGGITLRDVRANINPHMPDDMVLLGMSFMRELEMTQREGTLTLRIPR